MIKYIELIKNVQLSDIPISHQQNLDELVKKMNQIRDLYGHPMIVTSGYRTIQDHLRIYSEIAARKGIDFDPKKVPMGSNHLSGRAVDISDPKKELQTWCLANVKILEEVGLWCEDFSATPNWVHFQICQPGSGKRFFKP